MYANWIHEFVLCSFQSGAKDEKKKKRFACLWCFDFRMDKEHKFENPLTYLYLGYFVRKKTNIDPFDINILEHEINK